MAASVRSRGSGSSGGAGPRGGSIRELIARALEEARDEFAEIVQRKLEELMGEAPPRDAAEPSRSSPSSQELGRRRPRATSTESGPEGSRRRRTPESEMGELRARILAAMPVGEPMKRAQVLERAGLGEGDQTRVSNVLRKLKDEGIVQMKGERAAATYTRKG